jgi:hypothetical protein
MESVLIVFNLAQRYDVIVNANQADVASDFWMRFIPQSACSANDMADNIRGIIHYGDSTGTPRITQYDYVDDCEDMSADLLVPHVQIDVPSAHFYEEKEDVGLAFTAEGHIRWTVNGSSMEVQWGDPQCFQPSVHLTVRYCSAEQLKPYVRTGHCFRILYGV